MSDEPKAACAHLRVAYKPIDNGDGSMRERWECEACGHAFNPYRPGVLIPGLPARHMIVRDACRETHGDQGAVSEAIGPVESEARKIIGAWPKGQGHQFHFVLTVERSSQPTTSDVCPVCEGDDPFCPTCGGETGRRRRASATDDSTPAPAYKPLRDALERKVGRPGERDPDAVCEVYSPGEPDGDCDGDGHYLCDECSDRKADECPDCGKLRVNGECPPCLDLICDACFERGEPGDTHCPHCGAPRLRVVEPEAAAPETVAYHRDVKGATGARGSDAKRLDVVAEFPDGEVAHETITHVACPACGGTGDADRNANERSWHKCALCDGDGRVPEAVGAAHERGSS